MTNFEDEAVKIEKRAVEKDIQKDESLVSVSSGLGGEPSSADDLKTHTAEVDEKKVEGVGVKETTEMDHEEEAKKKEKKDKKEKDLDEGAVDKEKKEKKDKKDKDVETEEEKEKREKKEKEKKEQKEKKEKEKKEKKEKEKGKNEVEKIKKKIGKLDSKVERILAKKEDYIQRLKKAEEKHAKEEADRLKEAEDKTVAEKSAAPPEPVAAADQAKEIAGTDHPVGLSVVASPVGSGLDIAKAEALGAPSEHEKPQATPVSEQTDTPAAPHYPTIAA